MLFLWDVLGIYEDVGYIWGIGSDVIGNFHNVIEKGKRRKGRWKCIEMMTLLAVIDRRASIIASGFELVCYSFVLHPFKSKRRRKKYTHKDTKKVKELFSPLHSFKNTQTFYWVWRFFFHFSFLIFITFLML